MYYFKIYEQKVELVSSSMDSSSIAMIVVLLFLVLFSAFFSASETSISSVNRVRLKNKAENGNERAALVLSLLENYDRVLSCVLIANNIVNISAASLATVLFTRLIPLYGPTISTVVLTVVILIFGEITPKTVAKEHAERFSMFCAPMLRVFVLLLTPLNAFFSLWYKLAMKLIRASGDDGITE